MTAKGNVVLRGSALEEWRFMENKKCPVCKGNLRAVKQYKRTPTFRWRCTNPECVDFNIQKTYFALRSILNPGWGKE